MGNVAARIRIKLYFLCSLFFGLVLFCLLTASFAKPSPAYAAAGINQQINFQGRLFNAQGATVPDGYYNVQFKIYQDGDGQSVGNTTGSPSGSLKWTENYLNNNSQGVQLKNGFLSVQLGSITAFGASIDWNQDTLWLSMNIAGTGPSCTPFASCSPDGEMVPMKRISAQAYALNAQNANQLGGKTSSNYVQLAQGVQTDSSTTNASIFLNKTGATADILDLQRGGADVLLINNSGQTLFRPTSDSTTALQVQKAGTTTKVFSIDTTNSRIGIGNVTPAYAVDAVGSVNATVSVLAPLFDTASASTLAIGTTNATAINLNQNTTVAAAKTLTVTSALTSLTGATSGDALNVSNSTSTGNIAVFKDNATAVATIANGGAVTLQNQADSTAAFQVQNAAGTSTVLTVDTTNSRVKVGTLGTPTGQLYVSGTLPSAAIGSVGTGAAPTGVYIQGRYAYVTNFSASTLGVFDVSDPANPSSIGSVATGTNPFWVSVQGRYAYVVNYTSSTLTIYDVSNPASPSSVGSVATGTNPVRVYVQGRYAYVTNYTTGTLTIYDVANPASPVNVGSVSAGTNPYGVYVQGRYAYVTQYGSATLGIYDVSNPASPSSVGSVATGTAPVSVYIQGRYAYVANATSQTMTTYDISNPASPSSVGSVGTGSSPNTVFVQGRYAYVTNQGSSTVSIYDISNPASPSNLGTATTGTAPSGIFVQGRYAYVASQTAATLGVYDLGGANIQQLEVGGAQLGTLTVDGNTTLGNDASIVGGLQVGRNAQIGGDLGVYGRVNASTSVITPLLDTATAVALNIGTTNATVINFNQNTAVTGSKTFTVGTGLTSLGGGLAVTAGSNDFTASVAAKRGTDFSTTGNSDDVNFGNVSLVRLTGASAQTIRGIANGRDGYILTIVNAAGQSAVIANANTNSAAGNRILTGTGADVTLTADSSISLVYDSATSRWRVTGNVAASTGSYIQNQNAGVQSSSNFWISGTGRADTSLLTPTLDTATGVALNIGTATATGVNIATNAAAHTIAIGNGAAVQGITLGSTNSTSSLLLQAGTGNLSIQTQGGTLGIGNNAVAQTLQIGNATGATSVTVTAGSGGITLTGTTSVSGSNTFTVGTGLTSLGGGLAVTAGSNDFTASVATKKGTDFSTTGNSDDVNFGNVSLVRLTGASAQTIRGIANGRDGYILTIVNAAGQAATIANANTNSAAGNRILTGNGADISMAADSSVTLVYDSGASRWRVTGSAAINNGNFIQNQNAGVQASSNFWISGTGRADTSLLTPLLDTATAVALNIGTGTATGVNIATNAAAHTIAIGNGAAVQGITIGSTNSTSSLLMQAGTGNLQIQTQGGTLGIGNNAVAQTLQIGNATGATAVTVTAGSGGITLTGTTSVSGSNTFTVGTGLTSLGGGLAVTAGSSDFTASVAAKKGTDFSTTGNSDDVNFGNVSLVRLTGGSAQTIRGIANGRDGYILTIVNAAAQAATLANANANSAAGNRILTGTGADITLPADSTMHLVYDSGASRWRVAGNVAFTTGSYIQNQNAGVQSSSNFWISGTGRADTSLLTPTLDTATAVALNIGTATATGVNIATNAAAHTIAIGNGAAVQGITVGSTNSTSSLLMQAGTGNLQIQTQGGILGIGNNAVAQTLQIGNATGATAVTVTAGSGGITLTGTTSVSGSNTFTVGTGLTSLGGGLAVTAGSNDFTASIAAKKGTDYSTTGNSDNVNFGNVSLIRLTGGTAQTIRGIANGRDGYILTIVNAAAQAGVLANENANSTAGNRILTGTGGDISLPADASVTLVYDSGASRWRVSSGAVAATGGYIQNQNTAVQSSSNFWISGTGRADTSLLTPLLDTATAVALNIGTATATGVNIATNAAAHTIAIGNGAAVQGITIGSTNSTSSLLMQAGTGNLQIQTQGGTLGIGNNSVAQTLQIGNNTGATAVTVTAGSGGITLTGTTSVSGSNTFTVGTGLTSLGGGLAVTAGSSDFTASVATKKGTDFSTTGNSDNVNFGNVSLVRLTGGTAQTIRGIANGRDGYHLVIVNAAAQAATLANENANSTAGNRILTGTAADVTLPADGSITLVYDSGASRWRVAGNVAFTTGSYIQNQNAGAQSSSNFWITGTGRADTSVLTPLLDTATATTLNIATGTANAVNIATNAAAHTIAVGNGAAVQGITVGSTNSTSSLLLQAGTGNLQIQTQGGTLGVGNNAVAQTLQIGNVTGGTAVTVQSGTGGLNLGTGNVASTIQIGSTTLNSGTQTINIGTNNTSGGTNDVTIGSGSSATGGTTTLQAKTSILIGNATTPTITLQSSNAGNLNFGTNAVANTIQIGTTATNTGNTQSINIGNLNAAGTTNVTIGTGTSATAGTTAIQSKGNTTIATNGTTRATFDTSGGLYLGNGVTAASPNNFSISGTGSSTTAVAGGSLTIQGGNATVGNANGGNLTLNGGSGFGSGVNGLVVIGTPTFTTASAQNFTTSAAITQANVDNSGALLITSNASGYTATLGDPTITTAGKILYVTNSGSFDMTLSVNGGGTGNTIALKPNTSATMVWNGADWTAAGASSSTDLQSAYNNTLTSAGGAELVLNAPGGNADGLTIRNNATTAITGALLEVQTSIGSNLLSVNNNATEYSSNGGAETAGGSSTTFPASTWSQSATGGTQATVSRTITAGEFATGIAAVKVVTTGATTANQGAADQIAVNGTSTALTSNLVYTVSFTVKGTTNFNTLDVVYSKDGTNTATTSCATGQTVTQAVWSRISCSFTAPSSGITSSNAMFIRQSNSNSAAKTFYIDNLSVNINANTTYAADGSVDSALGTNWTAYDADGGAGTTTLARDTSVLYDTSGSVSDVTTAAINEGMRNNMSITPQVSTQYLVTFYSKLSSGTFTDLTVGFLPAGGNSAPSAAQLCTDYNTQTLSASSWTKITCIVTTPSSGITDPDLVIYQPSATARTFYVDALTITLNTNNSSNVQVGGGNKGGPATLFTLDRSNGAPIAANNDAYLGSMYYDTTTGRIQCYEADGWGACGAAPDNIVNLNPEYAGAVLNGSGVGTMTADFCSNDAALSVNSTLCASGQAKNFYKWTSPQSTSQTYSVVVTYQLPATFNGFASDDTVQLIGRVDNTSNASVTYEMYKSTGSAVTQCGSGTTDVITGGGGSANTWYSYGINGNEATGCSFSSSSAGNFIIFKINVTAKSNASAYISTLSFTTTGR